jgi:hypothetical protein
MLTKRRGYGDHGLTCYIGSSYEYTVHCDSWFQLRDFVRHVDNHPPLPRCVLYSILYAFMKVF